MQILKIVKFIYKAIYIYTMAKERPKKEQEHKSFMKPVSIFKADEEVINEKLSNYGDFSLYVRFCLRDLEQLKKFEEAKAAGKVY